MVLLAIGLYFIYTKWIFNTENPVDLSDKITKSPVAVEDKITKSPVVVEDEIVYFSTYIQTNKVNLYPIQEPQSFSDTADGTPCTPSTKVPGTVYTYQAGICKPTGCVSVDYMLVSDKCVSKPTSSTPYVKFI